MAFLLTNSQSHVIPHTHPTSDINGLTELIQANAVVVSATAPENPTSGKLWYNTTKGVFNIYNGSSWILVGPEVTPITKAQYDALSNDDKNDGRFYLITDNDGTIIVDWANVENKPTIPTSLGELSGTSDDITEGSSHLFMTPAERTNLGNQSGVNTGDQSASDFDIKDLADTTNLRSTWSGKQDAISDLATIRSGASAGATAVQPNDNVSTLTNDAGYITNAVNDLTNYYTKTQTYTKAEVDQMISDFGGFEVVETLPTENIKTNVIYLKGPIGTGGDRYEEWIYSNSQWVLIGETSVDLSNYFNTFTDTSDRITEGSTNLFVTSSEKTTWNAKQDALVSGTNIKTVNGNSLLGSGDVVIPLGKNDIVRSTLPPQDTTVLWYDTVNFVLNYYNDNAWKPLGVVNGGSVEPSYNITGNLWYDINNNVLKVYRVGTGWKDLAYGTSSSTAPTTVSAGHLWYDTTNNVLKVYNGTTTAWEDVNTNTTYTAGDGINIDTSNNNEISVDLNDIVGDGLYVDGNSNLSLDKNNIIGDGLEIDSNNKLKVDPNDFVNTSNGLTVDNNGDIDISTSTIAMNLDGDGLSVNGSTNKLDVDPTEFVNTLHGLTVDNNGDIDIDTSTLAMNLEGNGLSVNGSTNKLDVYPMEFVETSNGLTINSNEKVDIDTATLATNLAGHGLSVNGSTNKLDVYPIEIAGNGLTANGNVLDVYPMAFVETSNGLTINSNEKVDIDTATLATNLAGTGLYYNSTYNNISIDATEVATQTDLASKQDKAESGSGAPATTPSYVGQMYVDTTNDTLYVATGTSSSSDWTVVDTNTTYTAGDGIDITNNEISVDVTDIIGNGLSEDANNNLTVDSTIVALKSDLSNYYTKTQTYSKTEVDNLIANIGSFEVVATLPSADTADTKKIYLLGPIGTGADKYEEYIVTEDSQQQKQWTKIGETSIDLSGYATTTALTNGLATKQDTLTAGTGININANNEISNTLPGPTIAATAPTGTEGALWYDTTNDILMAYDGTDWKKAGTQMKVLSYGYSTWQDFIDAYNENAIVYCRASSNQNPATGTQGRMAFMAYVNSADNPTEVEFQYYRSRSNHDSAANQVDEVYVYKLVPANGGTWTVTQRNTAAKLVAGSNVSITWGSGNAVINATDTTYTAGTNISIDANNVISATDTTYIAGDGIDITNNEISVDTDVIQEKLTAGTGISITGGTVCITESDRKGPSPSGFHVPSTAEWGDTLNGLQFLGLGGCENAMTYLKLPMAGYREYDTTYLDNRGTVGCYWTSTPNDSTTAYILSFDGSDISVENSISRSAGLPIRAFKNTIALPDSTWTVLNGTLGSGGVFWNQTEGLITVTGDGTMGYTIMDKNLGATQVWNYGDAEGQEETCGKTYQWGNNYGFDGDDNLVILDPSHTKRDVTGYGPTNYYSNSYWVAESPWQNSTSNGNDLWGNVSNSTHQECETTPLTISSTVNGFNPSNTGTEGQVLTKTSTGYNWAAAQGGVSVGTTAPSSPTAGALWYDTTSTVLALKVYNGTAWEMVGPEVVPITQAAYDALSTVEKNNGKFYLITNASGTISVDWANVTNKPSLQSKTTIGSAAPSTAPTEVGTFYLDSTNDKLYVAVGTTAATDWLEVGSNSGGGNVIAMTQSEYNALTTEEKNDGKLRIITDAPTEDISVDWSNVANKSVDVSTQTGTLSSVKIWVGSQTDYEALSTKDSNTLYFTTNVVSGS